MKSWSTEDVAVAYMRLLDKRPRSDAEETECDLLRAEWADRPVEDRLRVLRRRRATHFTLVIEEPATADALAVGPAARAVPNLI